MNNCADCSESSIKTTAKKEGNYVYQKITKRTGFMREKTYSRLTQKPQVWNKTSTPSSSDCSSDESWNELDIVSPIPDHPHRLSSKFIATVEEVSAMGCELSVDRSEQRSKKTLLEKGYCVNETTSLMATSETSCSHQEDSTSLIIPSTRKMSISSAQVASFSDNKETENPNQNSYFDNNVQSLPCDIVNDCSALPHNNISKFEADLQFLKSLFSNESLYNRPFYEPKSTKKHPIETPPQNNQLLKHNPNSNNRHIVERFDDLSVCNGRLEVDRQIDYERSMRHVEILQNDTEDTPIREKPLKVTLNRRCFGSTYWRKVEIV